MKKKMLGTLGALSLAFAITTGADAQQTTSFNVSMWLPPTHPLTQHGYVDWLERMDGVAGLEPRLFTGSALLAPQDHLTGTRDGIAQIGWLSTTYNPSDLPEDNTIFHLAFVYTDYFVGSFAITEFNMTDPQMLQQWARNNVVYLSGYSTPPYGLICTSKVASLEDIKGKKLRSAGGALPEWAASVGAIPVNVASSETFTGLEKGQLDCATNALDDLRSRSYWDVAKHVTPVELGTYWSANVANRDFWHSLTTTQRKAILDATVETVVGAGIGYLKEVDEIVEQAKAKGINFYEPSADLEASIDQYKKKTAQFAAAMGEKLNVKDPSGLISRFEKVARKWQKLLKDVDRTDAAALQALLDREVYSKIDPATYGMK